jgi:HK97 family phage major capsid protein
MSAKIRALQAKKAEAHKLASALLATAEAAGRDLTPEEQAAFEGHKAQITSLNAQIERAEFMANEAAGLGVGGVEVPANAVITVAENIDKDQKRGFQSFGDFSRAVAQAALGKASDPRLRFQAAAPGSTVGNEANGADGGLAIPPAFSSELWRLSLGEESLLPFTSNTELGGNSMLFPKDETTPWGGAGIQTYWQQEAAAATASKPVISMQTLVLHKLMTLVPVTNEMIDDGFAVGSYLSAVAPERIMYKTNEAILFGDGAGKPLGALTAPATVIQAKDAAQATLTVTNNNISNMVSRLMAGQLRGAFWIVQPDTVPLLEAMTVGQYPIYLPGQTSAQAPYGTLKGRPLMLSEHASAVSTQGDINLVNLGGYRTITKAGGIQTATSMHLYFDADAVAYKFTFRLNGAPILSAPVTPPKSSNTRSHFVSLAAR